MRERTHGTIETRALVEIRAESLDATERTVRATLTTEAPVRMYDWARDEYVDEVLLMSGLRIRGSRGQVPLLDAHNRSSIENIRGHVTEVAVADGGRLEGTVRFAATSAGERALELVRAGDLTDLSVGYAPTQVVHVPRGERATVDGREYAGPVNVVREWELREVSLVPIGADTGATVRELSDEGVPPVRRETAGRDSNEEARAMAEQHEGGAGAPPVVDVEAVRREGAAAERARIQSVRNELSEWPEVAERGVTQGWSVERAREHAETLRSVRPTGASSVVEVTTDERDTFRAGAEAALLFRGRQIARADMDARGEDFLGMGLLDLARHALVLSGELSHVQAMRLSRDDVFARALQRSGPRFQAGAVMHGRASGYNHTTSDFPFLLANVANKSLQRAYQDAATTYQSWVRVAARNDFKTHSVVALSAGPDFEKVLENGEIPEGSLSERREQTTLATYGRGLSITRQTLINDDLDAFTRIPALMGAAARRKLNQLVYSRLMANSNTGETMADGNPLFDATNHGNYTSSGTAISVTSLGVARALMQNQTGLAGEPINVLPRFLITVPEVATVAEQLVGSSVDPAKSNSAINPFFNRLVVLSEPILSQGFTLDGTAYTGDTNHWFLAADSAQMDTVELGLLNGVDAPSLIETENEGGVLGMKLYAFIDAAAKAIDWRGLYRNAGA